MTGFREATRECGLVDVPLQGHVFTWSKSLGTEGVIEERLDRAMVTNAWMDLFPQCTLRNLTAATSDHSPILLETEARYFIYKKRRF